MKVCGVCGKRIAVMWPEFYVYKHGKGEDTTYYCSENCMIVADTREMKDRIGWVDPQAEMTEEEIEAVTHGRPVGFRRLRKTARREEQPAAPAGQEREDRTMAKYASSHKLTREEKEKAVELAISGKDPLSYLRERGAKNPSAAWYYIKKTLAKSNPKLLEKIPEKLGTVLDEKGLAVPADDSADAVRPAAVARDPSTSVGMTAQEEAGDPLEGFTAFDPGAGKKPIKGNEKEFIERLADTVSSAMDPGAPEGDMAADLTINAEDLAAAEDPAVERMEQIVTMEPKPEAPRDKAKRILDDLFRFPENVTAEQNPAGRVVLDKDGVHLEPPKEPKKPDWEKMTFFGIPCEVTGMKVEEFEFRRAENYLMMNCREPGLRWMDATVNLTVEQWKRVIDLVPKVMKIFGMDK